MPMENGMAVATFIHRAERLRAFILLMRWSGLAIRDAVTLERDRLTSANKLFCIGQKPMFRFIFLYPDMLQNCFDPFQTLIRATSSGQAMEIPRQLRRVGTAACVGCSKTQTFVRQTELPNDVTLIHLTSVLHFMRIVVEGRISYMRFWARSPFETWTTKPKSQQAK